jgi:hypothetical protein
MKYFPTRQFGFILIPELQSNAYFNVASIMGRAPPTEGDCVTCEAKSGRQGFYAMNIHLHPKSPDLKTPH